MNKKLQVFISSTYIDLKEERQAAVEAILDAGHIPAGMELFKSGNESQLHTIKRWIDESDAYLLILGRRYGTLNEEEGKSYTHLEYEYALEKNKPIFSVVLTDSFCHQKASIGLYPVFEVEEKGKFETFKDLVMSKLIRNAEDIKDIKLVVHTTLSEFEKLYDLEGWVRGGKIEEYEKIKEENDKLLKENMKLKDQLGKGKENKMIGEFTYDEIKRVLMEKKLVVPGSFFEPKIEEDNEYSYLTLLKSTQGSLTGGVTNHSSSDQMTKLLFERFIPCLVNFNLLEKNNLTRNLTKIRLSKLGHRFLAYCELDIQKRDKIVN